MPKKPFVPIAPIAPMLNTLAAIAACIAIVVVAATPATAFAASLRVSPNAKSFAEDFDEFCRVVGENYAYFDVKKTDWPRACAGYRADAINAVDRGALVTVLERALGELYDAHAHLGVSNRASPRLVPTNTDLWASLRGESAVIDEVRADSAAYKAGARPGMVVLEVDGVPIQKAMQAIEPRYLSLPDPAARAWALQSALAGRQNGQPVRLKVLHDGRAINVEFIPDWQAKPTLLSHRRIGKNNDIGLITIHNSLGDSALVKAFDEALNSLADTRGVLLDLRDTPSGGNSSVARGIMSRWVAKESPYQRHEAVNEFRATGVRRVWLEYVVPRGQTYLAPVVVLVGRWTGSMGEGIAIGLNAARAAPVLGQPMARLRGAVDEITLRHSRIVVRAPTEKLFSVDGTPRESFVPCAITEKSNDADALINAALTVIEKMRDGSASGAPPECSTFRP
jgi:hypothetical protein